ncbi:MAG: PEP-CTERM system histidine kinase PrsK [Sphingobium sp.]|nr:MAG: PEP-CTERM system histidine kinase PrsK [Sphingobium sp.]
MTPILQTIGDAGHALAAALFAALALWVLRGRKGGAERRWLMTALFVTAFWALSAAFTGMSGYLLGLSETLRNAAWLAFMFVLLHRGEGRLTAHSTAVTAIYGILAGLLTVQAILGRVSSGMAQGSDDFGAVLETFILLRMIVAIGALLLVHHLFTISAPAGRERIGLLMAALVAMWTYDLNLYTIAYLSGDKVAELCALRGVAMAALAPVMGLSARAAGGGRLRLSRTVAFRSFSLVAVGLYVVALGIFLSIVDRIAGPYAGPIESATVFLMAVSVLGLLPARRFRALIRVQVAKHFFQHRYDYRVEWIRFSEAIGGPAGEEVSLDVRVLHAVADITESPGAVLLLRDEGDGLACQAAWNWDDALNAAQVPAIDPATAAAIEAKAWIIDVDCARKGDGPVALPDWIMDEGQAWALVPLMHFGRMAGAILLARPPVDRALDWEDFDMLKAAGRQVASYIREAQGQRALDDAQRFDEFNRRFAFIMHDIKNLVSQLSLLARNAERHADNPDFRADMILTLRESVDRMNEMLARLSQHNKARAEEPRPTALLPVAERVVRAKAGGHAVEVKGDAPLAMADAARVEQILLHLVQNAIDASHAGTPVTVRLGCSGGCVVIDVVDKGEGMSADFIRHELFKPFASSKAGGFGIGAFEARSLAQAMGGRVEVRSRPGHGSCFTVLLPVAPEAAGVAEGDDRARERAA